MQTEEATSQSHHHMLTDRRCVVEVESTPLTLLIARTHTTFRALAIISRLG